MPRRSHPPVPGQVELRQSLGKRIRQLRDQRGLSQAELGDPHFDRQYVSAVELGAILPSLAALLHFARNLRISLSLLLRRRALTNGEMWRLLELANQGETGPRDRAIVWTLLGCGLRREELCGLRLADIDLAERKLHVRAASSKSVHPRDVTIPVEVIKELDIYLADHRKGGADPDDSAFTDRHGGRSTGTAVRKLFERLKVRTGIRELCAQMLRHTWATNFHRSSSGSRFDLMVEGGWTTGKMVERYTKARPFEERRRAPSSFTAARKARSEKRSEEKRPAQQISVLTGKRTA